MVARSRPEPYGYLPDGDSPESVSESVAGEILEHNPKEASNGFTVSQAAHTRDFWVIVLLFSILISETKRENLRRCHYELVYPRLGGHI